MKGIVVRWCKFCGAEVATTEAGLRLMYIEQSCPRCSGTDWEIDVDETLAEQE